MEFKTSAGVIEVNVVKNDYSRSALPVREVVVQGICDAFLNRRSARNSTFNFNKKMIVARQLDCKKRFYGFKAEDCVSEEDCAVRFNSEELKAAVEILKLSGYHFHCISDDHSVNYMCSIYPTVHGWTPTDSVTVEDDFNDTGE